MWKDEREKKLSKKGENYTVSQANYMCLMFCFVDGLLLDLLFPSQGGRKGRISEWENTVFGKK